MTRYRIAAILLALAAALPAAAQPQLAFPGAVGWAATTPGGRGGKVIRVTTLAFDGPGSLKAALESKGPRIVVFEVGGVIDFGRRELDIREPFLTIAGQTAPSPGITIIRGGINVIANDVVIRHIRVRTGADGQAKRSGWEADAMNTVSAHRVIVDHCSLSWAVDENLSAAGPRFNGRNAAEWRNGTSRDITFSYNAAYEGLADSSHPKGEHSKGSLVHDNVTNILFYRNVWASNVERSPLFKGGVHGAIVNNVIFNPGTKAVHYNLMALEWQDRPYEVGKMSVVGNVMRGGPDTVAGLPFMMLGGDGDVEYYGRDNVAVDKHGNALPMFGRYGHTKARLIEVAQPPTWPAGLEVLPSIEVETHLMSRVGARPWDRDHDDNRVLFFIPEARGQIINDEKDVSAYPVQKPTRAPFVEAEWNLDTMEPRSGRYPGQRNGSDR